MTLHIYLFGPLRARMDSSPLKIPPRAKWVSAWAYLLLHPEAPVQRSRLAYGVWPDVTEDRSRASLRRGLHRLQSFLPSAPEGRPWLLVEGESLQWNPEADDWIDVDAFERLASDKARLAEAVDLYQGDLLEGLYDDWVLIERDRWRERFLDGLSRLIEDDRRRGELGRAVANAERLLSAEPLREDAARLLIALRFQAGDRAGALRDYARFAKTLRSELASEPMPETQALARAIEANRPLPGEVTLSRMASEPGPPAGPSLPKEPPRVLPFVGRAAAMAEFQAAWGRAGHGQGSVLLLAGDSGIGKSRLVAEAARIADRQGGRVLFGAASPGSPIPYQPMIQALAGAIPLLKLDDLSPLVRAALADLLPEFAAEEAQPLPALEAGRERTRLFQSIVAVFQAVARTRPVLLLLEDLHWASDATFDLIGFLAESLHRTPMLILGTYRPEDVGREHPLRPLRRRLQRRSLLRQLTLAPLDPADVAEMLRLMRLRPANVPSLGAILHSRSEGNPFFLAQLLRDMEDTGRLTPTEDGWEARPSPDQDLPASIRQAIELRLERLSPQARAMLDAACILGSAFDLEVVTELGGWGEAQSNAALQELLDHQLIHEPALTSGFDYVFNHHLIQETAYGSLPESARKRRHRRAAQILEDLSRDRLAEQAASIAYHWDMGDEPVRAGPLHALSAQRAAAVYDDESALFHLDAALAHTSDPEVRFDLLRLRESISARRGDRAAQERDLTEMQTLASMLGQDGLACEVDYAWCLLQRTLGERTSEADRVESLKTRADRMGSALWKARALQAEGAYRTSTSRYPAAQASLRAALGVYENLDDAAGQVETLCLLAEISIQQGQMQEAAALLERARSVPSAQTRQSLLVQTLRAASAAVFGAQDFASSLSLGDEMLDLCQSIGDEEGIADAHLRLGTAHARLFHVEEARSHYAEAARRYEAIGRRQGRGAVLINAGFLDNWLGRYREAHASFEAAEAIFRELDDVRGQAVSALNLGMVAYYRGDHRTALAAAARGLDLARKMESPLMEANALANLGAAERDLGRLDAAVEHMRQGIQLRREIGQPAELAVDLCDLTVALLERGDLRQAEEAAAEMLALHDASPDSMMYPQHILWAAARTALAGGRAEQARGLFGIALDTLEAKAAAIPDETSRVAFLGLPFNRQIRQAQASGWPPQSP